MNREQFAAKQAATPKARFERDFKKIVEDFMAKGMTRQQIYECTKEIVDLLEQFDREERAAVSKA